MSAEAGGSKSSLRELETTPKFDTSTHEIMRLFYIPALNRATVYDRGVGYFTSNWMQMAAEGLAGLAANGGKARIIASPKLTREDVAAIAEGTEAQHDDILHAALQRDIATLGKELATDTLAAIAWMVADKLLEFRIAKPVNALDGGDFHDKFGIFGDGSGNTIAFNGSPNDSAKAFRNYESISAFYSWENPREGERVTAEIGRFNRLWEKEDPNIAIYEMPEAITRNLIEYREGTERPYPAPRALVEDRRWRHQREALAEFMKARNGVLEMATGTGKTRTAISIMNELFARKEIRTSVVAAFGTDLLDQWFNVLVAEGRPVYRAYERHREAQQFLNDPDGATLLTSRQSLAEILPRLPERYRKSGLLVCDEVHGLGSQSLVAGLSGTLKQFGWRLGLSATPEREYDAAGNDFIADEIGPVIFRFGLEEAIRRGILCEFDYVPLEYQFSIEDKQKIRAVIGRFHARRAAGDAPPIESLYQDLARVRKLSAEKLPPFRELVAAKPDILERSIIFVEEAAYGLEVQDVLMQAGMTYHTYYADDDRKNLVQFARGELSCLLTCHRISEGIDIRSVGTIVLFASARARLETVQRLGRCLRIDPAQPGKRALVIDFIRTDDIDPNVPDEERTADETRRSWFTALSEIQREAD